MQSYEREVKSIELMQQAGNTAEESLVQVINMTLFKGQTRPSREGDRENNEEMQDEADNAEAEDLIRVKMT
jgi:hypothetical protein